MSSPGIAAGSFAEFERLLERERTRSTPHDDVSWPAPHGLREHLRAEDGVGDWTFVRFSQHMALCIANVHYTRPYWINSAGDGIFIVRVLLSGTLLDAQRRIRLQGTGAEFQRHRLSSDGYFVAAGPTRMVSVCYRASFLSSVLGVGDPTLVQRIVQADKAGSDKTNLVLNPDMLLAANDIIRANEHFHEEMRRSYLEAKCVEIACMSVAQVLNNAVTDKRQHHVSLRDLRSINDARDVLIEQCANPPSVPQLARLVGMSQTRLKDGFRAAFGVPIRDFLLRTRMEKAATLLLETKCTVSEVAYRVGYEHPGNFSNAFRRVFGYSPRSMTVRRRHS